MIIAENAVQKLQTFVGQILEVSKVKPKTMGEAGSILDKIAMYGLFQDYLLGALLDSKSIKIDAFNVKLTMQVVGEVAREVIEPLRLYAKQKSVTIRVVG